MFILLLNQLEYFKGHVMYLDNRAVLSIQVRGHLYVVLNCLNYKSRDFLGVFLDTSLSGTKLSQSQVQAGTVLTFIKLSYLNCVELTEVQDF